MRQPPRLQVPLKQLSELPPKNPGGEQLTHNPPGVDPRPKMIKAIDQVLVPRFNTLYDSLRTTQGWRYMADGLARGTITTVAGQPVQVPVTLDHDPKWRLEMWPGAVQVFLAIRFFGIVPQALPTVNAGMECIFIDQFGNYAPLGEVLCQSGGNSNYDVILPTPITDPSNQAVGSLVVTQSNIANSNGTHNWSIGFSALYMLPSRYGYEILEDEEYEQIDHHIRRKKHHDHHSD